MRLIPIFALALVFKNRAWFNKGGKLVNGSKRKSVCCVAKESLSQQMVVGEMMAAASSAANPFGDDDEMSLLDDDEGESGSAGTLMVSAVVGSVLVLMLAVGVATYRAASHRQQADLPTTVDCAPVGTAAFPPGGGADTFKFSEDGTSIRMHSVSPANHAYDSTTAVVAAAAAGSVGSEVI
jgi:hypothetical protein